MGKSRNLRVELLNQTHNVADFVTSEPAIASFLIGKALQYQTAHACSVYLIVDDCNAVLGFFTLSNSAVSRTNLSNTQARKYFVDPIPAILIGQMARNTALSPPGFGRYILACAFQEALKRNEWQLMCVDPFSEYSHTWFLRMEFRQTTNRFAETSPNAPPKLPQLYMRRVDIEASAAASNI